MSTSTAASVWGRSAIRDSAHHRLSWIEFGPQAALCGAVVDVTSIYHCDPAGADAEPCIGTVCAACRNLAPTGA